MGNMKNTMSTDRMIQIASEVGAKAALEAIARNTARFQSMTANEAYKATERRLRALPDLQEKVEADKAQLAEYEAGIVRGRSKDIIRFSASGSRVSPEEKLDALKQDLAARIAADEYEIGLIENALKVIENDPYYKTVFNRYVLQENDEDIAEQIHCDASTVRRRRGQLVRRLAVRLYGVDAI